MKTKIKRKKRKNFECFMCSKNFSHKPYREYEQCEKPLAFCNSGCWKDFSDIHKQFMEDLFNDEVLSSYPVQQFIEYLKDYVDYEEFEFDNKKVQFSYKDVLKYIEDSIKESKNKKINFNAKEGRKENEKSK